MVKDLLLEFLIHSVDESNDTRLYISGSRNFYDLLNFEKRDRVDVIFTEISN